MLPRPRCAQRTGGTVIVTRELFNRVTFDRCDTARRRLAKDKEARGVVDDVVAGIVWKEFSAAKGKVRFDDGFTTQLIAAENIVSAIGGEADEKCIGIDSDDFGAIETGRSHELRAVKNFSEFAEP